MRWKKVNRIGFVFQWRVFFSMCGVALLVGCSRGAVYAPVTDVAIIEKIPAKGVHRVRVDETLYAIAWRYGMDYRELARINHISAPWRVRVGETLILRTNENRRSSTHLSKVTSVPPAHPLHAPISNAAFVATPRAGQWFWPAKGHLTNIDASFNRGINIAGHLGEPIRATAGGRVVYAGEGLRGYGRLIIIKHNNAWLSAYAWNQRIQVHEGERVQAGQIIANMGFIAHQKPMLHFEIRYNGKPVNPLRYLSRHSSV